MTRLVYFGAYCFIGGLITFAYLRHLSYRYYKLGVNHHPDVEALGTKVLLLFRNNVIVALSGVGIVLLYSTLVTDVFGELTLTALAATAVLFCVINTCVRVASYGYAQLDDERSDEENEKYQAVNARLNTVSFSFIAGLYLLIFFGLGLEIFLTGAVSTGGFPDGEVTEGALLATITVIVIFAVVSLSEVALWKGLEVPRILADGVDPIADGEQSSEESDGTDVVEFEESSGDDRARTMDGVEVDGDDGGPR